LEHEPDTQIALLEKTDREGNSYAWDSARIGAGAIKHVRLRINKRIEQRVAFNNPFRFSGRSEWDFSEHADSTEVTWRMNGRVAFSLRAFAQTVQGMIALDYRYGLDRLARLVEPVDAPRYSLIYFGVRDIPAGRYVASIYNGTFKGLGDALREGFALLRQQLADCGVPPAGEPVAAYVKTNIKLRTTVCRMGIPIADVTFDRLPVYSLPAHRAFVVQLQGTHAALEVAWYQAMQRMRIENIQPDPRIPPFERYLYDPGMARDNECITELYVPVRQQA
jgi:hypothetical protein